MWFVLWLLCKDINLLQVNPFTLSPIVSTSCLKCGLHAGLLGSRKSIQSPSWAVSSYPTVTGPRPAAATRRSSPMSDCRQPYCLDSAMTSEFGLLPNISYEKQGVDMVPGLPPNSYNVLATTSARVYHAQLSPKSTEWCYSRLKGILVFGKNNTNIGLAAEVDDAENYWFRLLDVNSGKIVWMFQVPSGLAYQQDRPFFHVFQGRVSVCSAG
jgi:hypothetical protein